MKTLSKKILTVCLALMMAVVMAVPAFATDDSNTLIERDYTPYIYISKQLKRGSRPNGIFLTRKKHFRMLSRT